METRSSNNAGSSEASTESINTYIYSYSGTGNSLWVARELAEALGDAAVISIRGRPAAPPPEAPDAVGIVFPVHMWGPPPGVSSFVRTSFPANGRYYFAVAVNTGGLAGALLNLRNQLRRRDIRLGSGYSVVMPNVFIPLGRVQPEPKRLEMFSEAEERIRSIAAAVAGRVDADVEAGSLWQRIVFSGLHRLAVRQVPRLDKAFRADERCTDCSVCARVCPTENIELVNGKPVWNHRCELCFSCIHWCPEEAIQFGKGTIGKERYHHPKIRLADMVLR